MILQYLHRPAKNKVGSSPSIFLLHGYGSNEEDLFSFASELPEHYEIFSFQAPIPMVPFGYAWYSIYFDQDDGKFSDDEQAKTSAQAVLENIDQLVQKYDLDPERVTLVGFSQGAILSLALGLNHPDRIWRVAAMSGYLNTALLTEDRSTLKYDQLRIFASHGQVDQVIPVLWARKTQPWLENESIISEYHEYPVGHGVAPQNFYDLLDWLKRTY
ncbi:alpha/beta hydrolase [Aureitalea marina]|uniref:Phospholipase n=1 Tax=Aureitalea marina TaxID=930804 RepID=A0A2S7KPE4_9FLAO|nr:alpha/beta fold hydrolase [Aureitalea marina]PQB04491.1 phospholipase [Aureitalea marina]